MKTSVVLTLYNGSKYLQELLDSLKNQTRKIDEVLIFDDRSIDESVRLVNSYIEKYQLTTWRVSINNSNLGWEYNFTQGINCATGDIIFPCDQDDIWHLDKIERMTNAFENNKDILLLVSGFHAFCENGGKIVEQLPVQTETKDIVSRVVFDKNYYQILRPGCTMAFHRSMLSLFNELWEVGTPHDALLWAIASIQQKLYLYNDTFLEYRRHDENASKNISHEYRYKINEIMRTKQVNNYFINRFKFSKDKKEIIVNCSKWCDYRRKLLVEKKRYYWFVLWLYRDYYLTIKKYFGDLYYSFQK